jgi:hypothetical protein
MSVFIYHRGTGTVIDLEEADVVMVDDVYASSFSDNPEDYLIADSIPGYDAIGYLEGYFIDEGGEG